MRRDEFKKLLPAMAEWYIANGLPSSTTLCRAFGISNHHANQVIDQAGRLLKERSKKDENEYL